MAMVVAASNPKARFYPNSCSGLLALRSTERIGTIGAAAQRETAAMVTALNLLIPPVAVQGGGPLSTRDH